MKHCLFGMVFLFMGSLTLSYAETPAVDDLLDMSLEELMNMEVYSPATLTKTKARLVPAAVTTISQDDIQRSGARSLYEALEIFVPGVQRQMHTWEVSGLGNRGLYSDRDDKYLLLVNGRIMNERMHYGALSELDLVMLRDINHIDVVRGPGSALYGPGAVSMVVNIVTDDAETFEGTEATIRGGLVENYGSGEFKHGHRFKDGDGGFMLYGSVGHYSGASGKDAPFMMATDFPEDVTYPDWYNPADGWWPNPDLYGEGTPAGDPITGGPVNRDNDSFRGLAPLKFHAQLTRDNWDIWARYTRGGKTRLPNPGAWTPTPLGWGEWMDPNNLLTGAGYQQATVQASYHQELSDRVGIDYVLSYDMLDYDQLNTGGVTQACREDEYFGRVMLKNELNPNHRLAAGFECSYEIYGLAGLGYPTLSNAYDDIFSASTTPKWDMTTLSAVGEYQWTINDQWSLFSGGRVDYTRYTNEMISPRFSLVHSPTDRDTLKYMVARSVRAPFAEEMKYQDLQDGSISDPEKLDSLEIRYEHQHDEALSWATSWYWYEIGLITWDSGLSRSVKVGTMREWGLELEAHYTTKRTTWSISHAFNQLDSMVLDPNRSSDVTAHLYGRGRHLSSWADHSTKFMVHQQINDQWSADGSMRIYWGYPGARDLQYYYLEETGAVNMQDGWKKAFRGSYFLNLGLQYQPTQQLTLRLDGYNLLGLFDKDLNKRNYGSEAYYRDEAAAFGVSLIYKTR